MLTEEQVAGLKKLGFYGNNRSYWDTPDAYRKEYGYDVYISVSITGHVLMNGIKNYPNAQRDLEMIKFLGIKV